MLPGTCNCDPFARTKGSFYRNFHEQSSFFDGFSTSHKLAIFVASIIQVREEGWMSGMRESGSIKKNSSPFLF
ncbi:hypothetical protein ACS0TY_034020 [Phlomoides rotata]